MIAGLHWLCIPEQVQLKIAVLVYKVLQGLVPQYLRPLDPITDLPDCLHLARSYQLFLSVWLFSVLSCFEFWLKTFKALNSLLCADVPLRNYSLTHFHPNCGWLHALWENCTGLICCQILCRVDLESLSNWSLVNCVCWFQWFLAMIVYVLSILPMSRCFDVWSICWI